MKKKKMLNSPELAEMLGVHVQTIYNWAREGMPRLKMGYNSVRYDLDEVMKWLEKRGENDKK